jgi:hypothetical protein
MITQGFRNMMINLIEYKDTDRFVYPAEEHFKTRMVIS